MDRQPYRLSASRASAELGRLREQADTPAVRRPGPEHLRWKTSVSAVLRESLGTDSPSLQAFLNVRYALGIWTGGPGEADRDRAYFAARVSDAAAIIEAAIYELGLRSDDEGTGPMGCDRELWNHVAHNISVGRWDQVASQSVIFFEDQVRRRLGGAAAQDGRALLPKNLMGRAFASDGPLRLGRQVNESEAWRFLAQGLVGAVGNVDRHGIQDRDDLEPYAMGVLGLTSLLLTQIRYEYPDVPGE